METSLASIHIPNESNSTFQETTPVRNRIPNSKTTPYKNTNKSLATQFSTSKTQPDLENHLSSQEAPSSKTNTPPLLDTSLTESETMEQSIQEMMQTNFEYSKSIINELIKDDNLTAGSVVQQRVQDLEGQIVMLESNFNVMEVELAELKEKQVQQDLDMRELVDVVVKMQKMILKN